MEKTPSLEENIKMKLPVEVEYPVLNELLNRKFHGKVLSKGKPDGGSSDQAKIEEIYLQKNAEGAFELSLKLKIKLLTSFFSGKEVEMFVHISPEFHSEEQEIYVRKYKIDGLNNGWIINNLLEGLVNSFLYNKLKNKMKFNLQPLLQSKLVKLNEELLQGKEIKEGIIISGKIRQLRVEKVIFGEDAVIAFLDLSGNNRIKVNQINI